MREELLAIVERNSRIDLKELAVILGVEEIDVVNELAALEAEGIIPPKGLLPGEEVAGLVFEKLPEH